MFENIFDQYHNVISMFIDEAGVFPHQMLIVKKDDVVEMVSMDLRQDRQVVDFIKNAINRDDVKEVICGLDRTCLPGQGTTLGDCVAGYHWKDNHFTTFIIEYQNEPRIVKPIDFENKHWTATLEKEIKLFSKKA